MAVSHFILHVRRFRDGKQIDRDDRLPGILVMRLHEICHLCSRHVVVGEVPEIRFAGAIQQVDEGVLSRIWTELK
jgi:hypothetical protein